MSGKFQAVIGSILIKRSGAKLGIDGWLIISSLEIKPRKTIYENLWFFNWNQAENGNF